MDTPPSDPVVTPDPEVTADTPVFADVPSGDVGIVIDPTPDAIAEPVAAQDERSPPEEPHGPPEPIPPPQESPEARRKRVQDEANAEFRLRITQMNIRIGELERLHQLAKDNEKKAKVAVENAEAELRAFITEESTPHLFSPPAPPPSTSMPPPDMSGGRPPLLPEEAPAAAEEPAAAEVPDERWRDFLIADLREERFDPSAQIKTRHISALNSHEQGILTIGQYQEFFNPSQVGWERRWKDIRGLGETGYTAIADALEKFWLVWRDDRESLFPAVPAPAPVEQVNGS